MKRVVERCVEVRRVSYEESDTDQHPFSIPLSRYAHTVACVDDFHETTEQVTPRGIVSFGGFGHGSFMNDLQYFNAQHKYWEHWYPHSSSRSSQDANLSEIFRSRRSSFEWINDSSRHHVPLDDQEIRRRANHSCIIKFDTQTNDYKLIFFGGMSNVFHANHCSEVLEYCCATKRWKQLIFSRKEPGEFPNSAYENTEIAKMKRSAHVFVYFSHLDKMYIHGGHAMEMYYDDVVEIDLKNYTWDRVTLTSQTKPAARCVHLGVIHSFNKFVVCFGVNGLARFNDMYEYDITHRAWKQIEYQNAPPSKRGAVRGVMVGPDTLFCFGGRPENLSEDKLNDFYLFHFRTRVWTKLELAFEGSFIPKGVSSYGMASLSMYSSNPHYQFTTYQSIQYFKLYSKIYLFGGNIIGDTVINDMYEITMESQDMLQTKNRLFYQVYPHFTDMLIVCGENK